MRVQVSKEDGSSITLISWYQQRKVDTCSGHGGQTTKSVFVTKTIRYAHETPNVQPPTFLHGSLYTRVQSGARTLHSGV